MLSVVVPIFSRAEMFRVTLVSLLAQQGRTELPWEILVVDDGSTDHLDEVLQLFAKEGLPLRCATLAQDRYPAGTWRSEDGENNPALALNVGIRLAQGERIVLTSPEIVHLRETNLVRLAETPMAVGESLVADVWDEEHRSFIAGGFRVRPLHFLCAYHKDDLIGVGAFDERFLAGRAWEDTEFCDRWRHSGRTFIGSGPAILGQHREHVRPETKGEKMEPYKANQQLFRQIVQGELPRVTGVEPWGDLDVVESFRAYTTDGIQALPVPRALKLVGGGVAKEGASAVGESA